MPDTPEAPETPKTTYLRRSYLLDGALEDDLVADLWQNGTLGVQSLPVEGGREGSESIRLEAWFAEDGDRSGLEELEDRWRRQGVETLGSESVPEQDWLALWRRGARPIPVGDRLLLDPREPTRAGARPEEAADASRRHLLRLPARRAFGTGSHESTRLVLRLLEQVSFEPGGPPTRVLDVGTGTGVLAFAARLFGTPRVVAYDVDPLAVFMAHDNARLNGFGAEPSAPACEGSSRGSSPLFFAGPAASLTAVAEGAAMARRFDLVLINVLPHRVAEDLPLLTRCVAPGGTLVVGGMLGEELEPVRGRLSALGFDTVGVIREGAWVACRCARRGTA